MYAKTGQCLTSYQIPVKDIEIMVYSLKLLKHGLFTNICIWYWAGRENNIQFDVVITKYYFCTVTAVSMADVMAETTCVTPKESPSANFGAAQRLSTSVCELTLLILEEV